MGYMKDWNEDLLLLMAETTRDDRMKRYIKSILLEKLGPTDIRSLYMKLRSGANTRNDILWNSIALALTSDYMVVELGLLKQILEEMPMDYLAIVSNGSRNEYIKNLAREICFGKQVEYEKEIGIFDKAYEKYKMDEEILRMEKRKIK